MIKNIFIYSIFLFFISSAFSQKCKTKVDPFTDERVDYFDFENKTVYFELRNKEVTFEIVFYYLGNRDFEFNEETDILLKLDNNEKLTLKSIRVSKPRQEQFSSTTSYQGFFRTGGYSMSSVDTYTAYSFKFLLSESDLIKLTNYKIKIIRLPDTEEGKYHDIEAKKGTKRKVKAINKGAKCISNIVQNS
ncbi:hypothetical protein [Tenacibaculum sp. SG-28]|uniref:hypothetical protein n=1 Tax=Tenacibaculum sp. SG-28 TaxID=754426 RepID=UPI000CF37C89|nr:hypothetical protein [Tenacibaculum sp. SG-28]PQJ20997.1 hypothetical protein BSU00_08140 [Tenacibaculum sp. SG-28]